MSKESIDHVLDNWHTLVITLKLNWKIEVIMIKTRVMSKKNYKMNNILLHIPHANTHFPLTPIG